MAIINKTIGATGRDYTTFTLWEADLDSGSIYSSGDTAEGEFYNDGTFNENFTINGGATIGLAKIILKPGAGQMHDGTAGNGARIVKTGSGPVVTFGSTVVTEMNGLEIDMNDQQISGSTRGIVHFLDTSTSVDKVYQMLIHDAIQTSDRTISGIMFTGVPGAADILNSIMYNLQLTDSLGMIRGIFDDGSGSQNVKLLNLTIHKIERNAASGNAEGVNLLDGGAKTMQNVIVTDTGGSTSGSTVDFANSSYTNATVDHNLSSDTTASGTGSLTSKTSANQYVSTVSGSEDLHLKSGADAIDAGTDLGVTPSGVELDINNRDRDSNADVWDMGAHE
ncbi:MAG: hypothetical protein ACE5FY_08145, partial [Nitrospiria bacterium]